MDVAARTTATSLLAGFRAGLYDCLTGWADALFETSDALLAAPGPVTSVPRLSLEGCFRRSHGSLYKALDRGRLDVDALRRLLVTNRPADWPQVFAVDATTWDRCDAETSPERGFYYHASKHSAGQPIVAGWSYQVIAQLNWAADSWTAPIDVARIPPTATATHATIAQIDQLLALLNDADDDVSAPMFVLDAGYDPIALTHAMAGRAQVLARIRNNRVFYAAPPPPTGRAGRPARHGRRFACNDADTWPPPDDTLTVENTRYGTVTVTAWHQLHPKLGRSGHWAGHDRAPIVAGSIIRVEVEHLPRPRRALKTLWLWWSGPGSPDLQVCWRAYLRRFDIEHTFRFLKNTLGWTTPSPRTPAQADRWSWLIIAAYTQLRLARGLIADQRMPWERPRDPQRLTPARIRRGFQRLSTTLGSPARPPKSRSPGPGRPKGTRTGPRTRHPAIKKAA